METPDATHFKHVVVIGGGTGTFTVLQGLRDYPHEISAIVSTADDGGSTGVLRDELGVLPPGDLRQALVALSEETSVLRELLNYRFEEGSLQGHNFGNLLLSALEKITGRPDQAILEAGKILAVRGRVLPVTTDNMRLKAETVEGKRVTGEHAIEAHIWGDKPNIKRLWLEPACTIHPLAKQAILKADLLVIAPGSIFTSLIPNLLVGGMREALDHSRAKIAYVVNLMTEKGQAQSFCVQDFVSLIEEHLGNRKIDYVVYNTKLPPADLLDRYRKEMERIPVRLDLIRHRKQKPNYRLIRADLLDIEEALPSKHDRLARQRTLIRHDSRKLGRLIDALLYLRDVERYLH